MDSSSAPAVRRVGVEPWSATLDVRTAALDVDEACFRLALRHPYHRTGDTPVLYGAESIAPCTGELTPDERLLLELDYPRGVLPHAHDRSAHGRFEQAHVADYVQALLLAHERLLDPPDERAERRYAARRELRPEVRLRVWQARYRVWFLAGRDKASARERAGELAATIVDYAGRPFARIHDVRPDRAVLHWDTDVARALWRDHEEGDRHDRAGLLARSACELWRAFLVARVAPVSA
ncbi:hypothetical protein B0I33_107130 [Prauserella shujinwangii]|uniref:Uncharacterized protein n=1 Tax=Prauserella shujinwangii TaxID=1453103 RepID=A0A2T0LSF6_9PSEU|nr:hypothetical protein [Prauserella shujinwangii]PRX46553.1 hypothetical protein B0I33_107130 [Prauserella shujinwangii]